MQFKILELRNNMSEIKIYVFLNKTNVIVILYFMFYDQIYLGISLCICWFGLNS